MLTLLSAGNRLSNVHAGDLHENPIVLSPIYSFSGPLQISAAGTLHSDEGWLPRVSWCVCVCLCMREKEHVMVLIHIMVSWCLLVSCYSLMLLCVFCALAICVGPWTILVKMTSDNIDTPMVELHSNWNRYEKVTTVGGLQQNYCTGPTYPHFLSCPGPHAPLLLPPTAAIHRAGRILWLPGITAWWFLFNYCNIIRLLHAKLVLHTFLS